VARLLPRAFWNEAEYGLLSLLEVLERKENILWRGQGKGKDGTSAVRLQRTTMVRERKRGE